ncbi:MAG TPA: MFS transporter, partial [Verrucomicrobiae bacterium]|nr:MFS transporter [Verrucomicrobiae bacterium]
DSKLLLGTVAAAASAPMFFLSTLGGSLADRYPKRNIVLTTQITMMLLAFVLTGLAWENVIQPIHLIIIAALGGAAMAFDMPARQSFFIEITSREDLMNAVSLNSAIVNGARVVGPAVAGLIMARLGVTVCFLVNALSYLAIISALLMMRLDFWKPTPHEGSAWSHVAEGFRYAWNNFRIRVVLCLFAVVGVFGWSYSVIMPAYATDVLHVSEHGYGLLLAANGLGAFAGALTVAVLHKQFKPRVMAFAGLWLFSGSLLLLSVIQDFAAALFVLVAAGWGMMLFFSTTNIVVQTAASDKMRGRVMGIWALIFGGMTPLGSMEAGSLSQTFGVPLAIRIGALVCVVAGIVTWLIVRRRPSTHLES